MFTINQSDQQGVGTYAASNPNIKQETGTTYTLGMVVTPTSIEALRNVTFSMDYYNIDLADAIQRVSTDTALRKFHVQNMPDFCSLITRRSSDTAPYSAGSVEQIVQGLVNSGGLRTEGIDLTLSYAHELNLWGVDGMANFGVTWNYLLAQGTFPLTGDPYDTTGGEIGSPKNKGAINIGYDAGSVGLAISLEYVGAQFLDNQFQKNFLLANGSMAPKALFQVDPVVYMDLQLHYDFSDQAQFYFGVKNLFNQAPAPIITGLPGDVAGTETASGMYDPIGRRFYTGVRIHL